MANTASGTLGTDAVGAKKSFRGRRWRVLSPDPGAVTAMSLAGIDAAAPILAARGLLPAEAPAFLRPRVSDLLPSPWIFNDMEAAADRIVSAMRAGEKIVVWGDYDVDGATSSSIVRRYLRSCGVEAGIYVPDRVLEGYGPNAEGLLALRDEGVDLVIVVDSGTVAFDPISAARRAGLDIVVVDHHAQEASLPEACAIVNPNRKDQAPGYGMMCAAGMAFMLVHAIAIRLRAAGAREVPDPSADLDLVALGTVCDVVPLVGINRAFVAEGLLAMARRGNTGLRQLARVSGLFNDFKTWELGFILGPRINAGGRIGQSDAGAILLHSEDEAECERIAKALDAWNRERQELEHRAVDEAKMAIEGRGGPDGFAIAASPEWHEGVVGIVASRLKDFYDVPSFCFSLLGDRAKGSGRGIPGFNLGAAVIAAKEKGLLLKGGGHAMAAGVTCETANLRAFADFMREEVRRSGVVARGLETLVDAEITPEEAELGLCDAMAAMEPFGQENPAPRFLIRNLTIISAAVSSDGRHLKIELTGGRGRRFEAPMFGGAGTPFGEAIRDAIGRRVDIVASLKSGEYKGTRKLRLDIEDARFAA